MNHSNCGEYSVEKPHSNYAFFFLLSLQMMTRSGLFERYDSKIWWQWLMQTKCVLILKWPPICTHAHTFTEWNIYTHTRARMERIHRQLTPIMRRSVATGMNPPRSWSFFDAHVHTHTHTPQTGRHAAHRLCVCACVGISRSQSLLGNGNRSDIIDSFFLRFHYTNSKTFRHMVMITFNFEKVATHL